MSLMAKQKDRHVMEALGKTRVVVENGKVVEVGEPQTEYCPISIRCAGSRNLHQRQQRIILSSG